MNYFFKKTGFQKRADGFIISEIENAGCQFWEDRCLLFFGSIPKDLKVGDIFIQEVSSIFKHQNHAIVGVYRLLSPIYDISTIHDFELSKPLVSNKTVFMWNNYAAIENLTPKFSRLMKNKLMNKESMIFNLDNEWKKLDEPFLPYYGAGHASVPHQKGEKIAKLILDFETIL